MPLFEPVFSWPITLLIGAALFWLVWRATRADAKRLTAGRARTLLVLRGLTVLTLLFGLIRPAWQMTETSEKSVQLLIARDTSRSMNTADIAGGQTRLAAAKADWENLQTQLKAVSEKLEVRPFEFSAGLQELAPDEEATGQQTAIGHTLEELAREARQRRTVAVLLQTDGAQRALPPLDQDPLSAARTLGEQQVPVYPVGYGAASIESLGLDLALEDLAIDPVVFEKKTVPLSVRLRSSGGRGQRAQVKVLIEDRRGKRLGESGNMIPATGSQSAQPQVEIPLNSDNNVQTVELSFVPNDPGELKIAVEVTPLPGEVLTRNNRVETVITVRKGGLKVACFDIPRPEQRWLRMVNGEENIQLDFIEVRGGKFARLTKIDPALFERGRYDVYLIGDVPASVFGPQNLQALAQRCAEGAGFMMYGGARNFSVGGYGATPLADFLPVQLGGGPRDASGPEGQTEGALKMTPTSLGLRRFVLQLEAGAKNRERWESLAPLEGATSLRPRADNPLVEVWAETPDGIPLMVAAEVGKARVIAFGGDTTWRWALAGRPIDHQRFWRQAVLWLARKEADSTQEVWVRVEPRNFVMGQTVVPEFGARLPDGTPLTDATFAVEILRPDGSRQSIPARKSPERNTVEIRDLTQPGDYWISVTAQHNGASLGFPAMTRFIVDARDLELDEPAADYDLLRQLASTSGGQLVAREELPKLLERLLATRLSELSRIRTIPLWDNWPMLLTFVGLQSLSWYLRKSWGLV